MTPNLWLNVKKLHPYAIVPAYQTSGSACFDLHSIEPVLLSPGQIAAIRTGLAFEIAEGWEVVLRPRSGKFLYHGLYIHPGTIDSDFRGEVNVIVRNESNTHEYKINVGDRIAQGALKIMWRAGFHTVDELSETSRGQGGFGSTGE
jgi:dUTP pyrophosphatase